MKNTGLLESFGKLVGTFGPLFNDIAALTGKLFGALFQLGEFIGQKLGQFFNAFIAGPLKDLINGIADLVTQIDGALREARTSSLTASQG
jgi:hypothetical protein